MYEKIIKISKLVVMLAQITDHFFEYSVTLICMRRQHIQFETNLQ